MFGGRKTGVTERRTQGVAGAGDSFATRLRLFAIRL